MTAFDIFLSYRRDGGFETAKHLYDLLVRDGYAVSFDIDTLREGDFDRALLKRIEMCEDFVLIVDPHCFDRTLDPLFPAYNDWLRQELSYALYLNKNIIPVLLAGASFPSSLPEDIRQVCLKNGPTYSREYFDSFYQRLRSFLHSRPVEKSPMHELSQPGTSRGADIHIETDADCSIFRFKEKVIDAKKDEDNVIYLHQGKHYISYISKAYPEIKKQITIEVPSEEYSDILSIKILISELDLDPSPLRCVRGFNNYIFRDPFSCFHEGLACVKKDWEWGFIDKLGREIIPFIYYDAYDFNEGLACVSKLGKWGFIDRTGQEVIPCKYDSAVSFSEGLASIKSGWKKWGFINKKGKEVIPPQYDFTYSFRDGLARFEKNRRYGFLEPSGRERIPGVYFQAGDFSEGLASIISERKAGFIDMNGRNIIPCIYDKVSPFTEGFARVKRNGKWGFVNRSGEEVITPFYDNAKSFSEGLACVKKGDKWGFVNRSGKEVIAPIYDDVGAFSEGLACVKKCEKWGYINNNGNNVIPFSYDDAYIFKLNIAEVKFNGKYAYIDRQGSVVDFK